jgi:hypothetical protein
MQIHQRATTRVSSDPYPSQSEMFSTLIRAEAVCPPYPTLFFSLPHSGLTVVIQNLELQPGPNGQIVHRNLMVSLATESQDSSHGGQPPQQLDLAQSFNDMHISLSTSAGGTSNTLPSRSRGSQLPITPYGRDGSLAPTTPHHLLQPSHSFSTLPTRHPDPSSQRSPHSSQPIVLPHQPPAAPALAPAPVPTAGSYSACAARRGPPTRLGAPV